MKYRVYDTRLSWYLTKTGECDCVYPAGLISKPLTENWDFIRLDQVGGRFLDLKHAGDNFWWILDSQGMIIWKFVMPTEVSEEYKEIRFITRDRQWLLEIRLADKGE